MTAVTQPRPHGTRARYVLGPGPGKGPGCRCGQCTKANRQWNANRERQVLYGRWQPYVDAEPVREHLRVHRPAWSHLTADTQQELHGFAARLGLRRQWFQPGRPIDGQPSPFWHYDVTSRKRAQALAMGAAGPPSRELARYCRTRAAQPAQASSDTPGTRGEGAGTRPRRAGPDNPCPDCGRAELTHGRKACQACGLLRILAAGQAQPSRAAASAQPEAGS